MEPTNHPFWKEHVHFSGFLLVGLLLLENQPPPPGAVLEQSFQSREVDPPSRVRGWVRSRSAGIFFWAEKKTTPETKNSSEKQKLYTPKFLTWNLTHDDFQFRNLWISRGWCSAVITAGVYTNLIKQFSSLRGTSEKKDSTELHIIQLGSSVRSCVKFVPKFTPQTNLAILAVFLHI